jgi:hypothetical protein
MTRPKAHLPHHPLAQQILALALTWLALAAGLPTNTLSSPMPSVSRVRFDSSLAAALPIPAAMPPDPAPVPARPPLPPPQPAPAPPPQDEEARKWGEITVGQPKIWQYERVNSLLDGLLRDVEGISTSDLIGLDPNTPNGAAVKFVQSMLEIGVQYNQGAAVTNKIALQNYATAQSVASAQIQANSAYLQQLNQQRDTLSKQLADAMELNRGLQTQLATTLLDPSSADYKALAARQQAAANEVTSLQSDLTSVNSQITAASTTTMPAAPNLTSTTGGTAPESANTFSSFLGNLPPDLTKNIVSQLQSPSLPATKRMDNFITLLYERLAREISVLQDDVMRDPDNVPFLVQFDVGLYPASQAQNHVAVVEFTMNCEGCEVYSIYPGQSSYNLANYEGASKRYSLWGAFSTLFGFGINAAYRRQTDTLHGDLVQSVYTSGFEEGAESEDRIGNGDVAQRFGWYYGSAPFETRVTPGIRTTFAIISIPRNTLKSCLDEIPEDQAETDLPVPCLTKGKKVGLDRAQQQDGPKQILLHVKAHADWVQRDNPYRQDPHHWYWPGWWTGYEVGSDKEHGIRRDLKIALPGTDAIEITPVIVFKERERLHVTGLEYNPVYFPRPTDSKITPSTSVPSPGTTQATATGTGSGNSSVTITGAGTANVSSSGTGGSTATATVSLPPPATSTPASAGGPSTADALTGCKQYECAALLVKLAEPIDPNLAVSVKGVPLRRVRDWRGRATSILPPVQSASDVTPPPAGGAAAATQTPRSENAASSALLEADRLGPDTWMEVDSHRLLINVSKNLAGTRDFPTIQIIDPTKRTFFLPIDLDQGFSEIIMNDFHLPVRDEKQLRNYIGGRFRVQGTTRVPAVPTLKPSGPYAYGTFLPLFLPERDYQKIDAYLGESAVQIIVELVDDALDRTTQPPRNKHTWLPSRMQVILEDADLDLAWSLSCYVQGADLVCDVPWKEIQTSYRIVADLCSGGESCPSISKVWDDFPSISSLQVWVEQYDPDSQTKNSFYTPDPAKLGRYPMGRSNQLLDVRNINPNVPDKGFRSWYFDSTNQESTTVVGCNYPEFSGNSGVTILGRHIPFDQSFRRFFTSPGDPRQNPRCNSFTIPTVALTHEEIALEYETSNDPESLSASRFQPYYDTPDVTPNRPAGTNMPATSWRVDIPVGRVDCYDVLDVLGENARLNPMWRVGPGVMHFVEINRSGAQTCQQLLQGPAQQRVPDWNEATKTGQVILEFTVPRIELRNLPLNKQIRVLRGQNLNRVGTLPDLQSMLFPTTLKVVSLGTNQFALQGDHAGVIDAVSVQGPGPANATVVVSGQQAAVVTLSDATPPAPKANPSSQPQIKSLSTESGPIGSAVTITGANFTNKPIVQFTKGIDAPVGDRCWNETTIVVHVPDRAQSGTISVTIGTTPKKSKNFNVTGNPVSPQELHCALTPPAPPAAGAKDSSPAQAAGGSTKGPKAGMYTVVPLIDTHDRISDPKRSPQYLPIDVVDPDGKPLTFTVPESKDANNSNTSKGDEGPTTTLTISKKTTVTPAPKPANATPNQ